MNRIRSRHLSLALGLVAAVAAAGGCSGHLAGGGRGSGEGSSASGQGAAPSLARLEARVSPERLGEADTLDLLELGTLWAAAGRRRASNAALEEVFRRYVEREDEAVISLRRTAVAGAEHTGAAALGTYDPTDYEKLFVLALKLTNHLLEGDLAGARVEARRVDLVARALGEHRGGDAPGPDARYPRLLAAAAHAAAGGRDDARVAAEALGSPGSSRQVGRLQRGLQGFARTGDAAHLPDVLVVAWVGRAPRRESGIFTFENPVSGTSTAVAVPVLREVPWNGDPLTAGGEELEVVADLDALARAEWERRHPAEVSRAATRLVAHTVKDTALATGLGWPGRVLATFSNRLLTGRADTRCWESLPKRVAFAALRAPGPTLRLRLPMGNGPGGPELSVPVAPGRFTVVQIHLSEAGVGVHTASVARPANAGPTGLAEGSRR